jgi:plasmid stabilization system protein ParE
LNARFTRRANEHFVTALQSYEANSPRAARRFVEQLDRVLTRIRTYPRSSPEVLPGLYRAQVLGTDYAVFYLISSESIDVVGVLHGRQSPEEWRRLVPGG